MAHAVSAEPDRTGRIRRTILRGGAVSLGCRLGGIGLAFAAQATLARYLGVEAFGAYAALWAWVLLLVTPAKLGLDQAALKLMGSLGDAGTDGRATALVRRLLARTTLGASVVAVAGGLALGLLASFPEGLGAADRVLIAVAILALALLGVVQAIFRGLRRILFSQVFDQIVRPLALLVGLASMGVLTGIGPLSGAGTIRDAVGLNALAAGVALLLALLVLAAVVRRRRVDGQPGAEPRPVVMPAMGELTTVLFLNAVVQQALTQASVLVAGVLLDPVEVAHFAAAARLAAFVGFGLVALNSITAPMIAAHYREGSMDLLGRIATTNARLAIVASLAVALALLVLGPYALRLFGPDFEAAYPLLFVLVLAGIVNAAAGPVGFLLAMTQYHRALLWSSVASLAVGLPIAVVLTAQYGAMGAAAGAVVLQLLQNAIRLVLVWRRLRVDASFVGLHKPDRTAERVGGSTVATSVG